MDVRYERTLLSDRMGGCVVEIQVSVLRPAGVDGKEENLGHRVLLDMIDPMFEIKKGFELTLSSIVFLLTKNFFR